VIQIFQNADHDFVGKRRWAYAASVLLLVAALASLLVRGLRYDIDFTGGTLIQIRLAEPASPARIRAAVEGLGLGESVVQEFGDPREFVIRTRLIATDAATVGRQLQATLAAHGVSGAVEIRRAEFVGPRVGRELQRHAVEAVLAALAGMLVYIALRFDLKGGVAAVVEVFHDVIICLGALSVTNREFSLAVLAALLTIIGVTVNDTIVTFDRLRENRTRPSLKTLTVGEQMNRAINQTLSRTVLTVLTVLFAAATLFFFGGRALEDFAFVLLVGTILGTVSTVYVAGSIVVDWTEWAGEGRARPRRSVPKRVRVS
jgi:preprotein translocase subunit SecF